MRRLWIVLGRISYVVAWPALYLYLKGSQRTRIVVKAGDKVLVVKDWLGDGKWKLPGGGVHKGEYILNSARRELFEETGIKVKIEQMESLGTVEAKGHGTTVMLHVFQLNLPRLVDVKKQKLEIIEADWKTQ